ncbi:VTT domain-containing protein [Flavobacterium sp. NRK F10]|uniref:YqaA family protein n=1 Tax=Flavobacterium sp. NRK F10 TaxID=2954931 RepID=UPI002091AF49|nr:VTT domain-containing protein [Flavobacterium sp. NRK F10]MCO6176294.1 VTT domain-containing protein [Flavobacterium sp. NRK F10]
MQKQQKKSRAQLLHQYYKYTGFYAFIWNNTKKAIMPLLLIIGALLIVNYRVMSISEMLLYVTQNFSKTFIFSLFFASESFLGLLPPDIFIAWTKTTEHPLLYLSLLAVLSYLGGVVSYYYGRTLLLIPKINDYLEGRMSKHIRNMQKWGGFLIAVGALLPLPFAMACLAAGMIKFPQRQFFAFAALRIFRFVIYGFAIYSALS